MKIKKYIKKEEFCYPIDFIYISKENLKIGFSESKIWGSIALILYLTTGIFLMILYYITLPFKILNSICEKRCFY